VFSGGKKKQLCAATIFLLLFKQAKVNENNNKPLPIVVVLPRERK
jgi:hypothetical protein